MNHKSFSIRNIKSSKFKIEFFQMEFFQTQQKQATAAAAEYIASAKMSRCEECNISFSKYQVGIIILPPPPNKHLPEYLAKPLIYCSN
jgi:hypothetical protein